MVSAVDIFRCKIIDFSPTPSAWKLPENRQRLTRFSKSSVPTAFSKCPGPALWRFREAATTCTKTILMNSPSWKLTART
nr:hypothetical protein [Allobaculum sp. Allo2]